MRSVIVKIFSCQYEAITALFNLLCGDLIRRGLCWAIFSEELLFSVRQNGQTQMRSNFLACLKSDALCACWVVGFCCLGLVVLVSDLPASVLGHWVPFAGCWEHLWDLLEPGGPCAPACLVGIQGSLGARPAPFECFGSALGFNLGVSGAIFLYVRGRRYKCPRTRDCTLKSSDLLSM